MKKITYATNGESDSFGFYDEDGFQITAGQFGDDMTFHLQRVFTDLGIELVKNKCQILMANILNFFDNH